MVVTPVSVLLTLMMLVPVPVFGVKEPMPEYVRPPNVPVRVTVVLVTV